ncbi:hypothetical protein SCHPADRAFT_676680 [Schizopora paradoxa]|uniref:Uncharacterized protein n=1 Tax=Schizopora paradoxa TaxID=27342 RepID=A0A0H2R4S5_9AGAM|nr:hypothetical protein SCHPADRAFT_676680 [Schizopora paradoxa]
MESVVSIAVMEFQTNSVQHEFRLAPKNCPIKLNHRRSGHLCAFISSHPKGLEAMNLCHSHLMYAGFVVGRGRISTSSFQVEERQTAHIGCIDVVMNSEDSNCFPRRDGVASKRTFEPSLPCSSLVLSTMFLQPRPLTSLADNQWLHEEKLSRSSWRFHRSKAKGSSSSSNRNRNENRSRSFSLRGFL